MKKPLKLMLIGKKMVIGNEKLALKNMHNDITIIQIPFDVVLHYACSTEARTSS